MGPIQPATAARLACDANLLGAVVDAHGDVLALGRSKRPVSKKQRRALMVRDRMCQFPACHRTRHLHAHHVIPWSAGAPTDLANLILLCETHHTYLHEGGITLTRTGDYLASEHAGWQFRLPDGRDVAPLARPGSTDAGLRCQLELHAINANRALATVTSMDDPPAAQIVPGWRGEPFSLHDCVYALFDLATIHEQATARVEEPPGLAVA